MGAREMEIKMAREMEHKIAEEKKRQELIMAEKMAQERKKLALQHAQQKSHTEVREEKSEEEKSAEDTPVPPELKPCVKRAKFGTPRQAVINQMYKVKLDGDALIEFVMFKAGKGDAPKDLSKMHAALKKLPSLAPPKGAAPEPVSNAVQDDRVPSKLQKFFSMAKVGVPKVNVKAKMKTKFGNEEFFDALVEFVWKKAKKGTASLPKGWKESAAPKATGAAEGGMAGLLAGIRKGKKLNSSKNKGSKKTKTKKRTNCTGGNQLCY